MQNRGPTPMTGEIYQIHSQARGPHWIAWVTRDGSDKPDRAVVLVGKTQEAAEARARTWAEQTSY